MLLSTIEANHKFFKYYKSYVNPEWSAEYFAYDHCKSRYKAIKARHEYATSNAVFLDFQQQCRDEIARVHHFLVVMIRQLDRDLVAVNEMLGNASSERQTIAIASLLDADRAKQEEEEEDDDKTNNNRDKIDDKASESDKNNEQVTTSDNDTDTAHHTYTETERETDTPTQHSHTRTHSLVNPLLRSLSAYRSEVESNEKSNADDEHDNDSEDDEDDTVHVLRSVPSRSVLVLTEDALFRDRSIELSLRNIFQRIKQLQAFYRLNFYCIRKISKKMDKLLKMGNFEFHHFDNVYGPQNNLKESGSDKMNGTSIHTCDANSNHNSGQFKRSKTKSWKKDSNIIRSWKETSSGKFFFHEFVAVEQVVEELKQECVTLYARKFRQTYPELAEYELEYVKEKDRTHLLTQFLLGIKFGLIACIIAWIVLDSYTTENDIDFWEQPGLYIYTCIGNLLLYRLSWAWNIAVWSHYDVNYISILRLSNIKPNLLLVVNQTASLLLLYFLNLLVFFRANSASALSENSFLSHGTPFLLLIASVLYQVYEYVYLFGGERVSRGVFSRRVLRRCLQAPLTKVLFRDVFAADVLTSFTRIIADSLYASCYVLSGSFLRAHDSAQDTTLTSFSDFGSSYMHCTGRDMVTVVSLVQMLPLVTRTLQCLHSMRDSGWTFFPQGYNALKYLLSILVVLIALEASAQMEVYFFFIALSTLYKWYWDVAMDFGLCGILPRSLSDLLNISAYARKKMFLRENLMYPSVCLYYVCIVADLVLRFLWVLSTLPPDLVNGLVGYQLSFFLGAMEILRRAMWSVFRVEYEHLKMLKNKTPGFLSNRVMQRHAHGEEDGNDSDEEVDLSWKAWKAKVEKKNEKKVREEQEKERERWKKLTDGFPVSAPPHVAAEHIAEDSSKISMVPVWKSDAEVVETDVEVKYVTHVNKRQEEEEKTSHLNKERSGETHTQ